MAKYTVNYSCGHGSIVKELFGKVSERERKIEWMEENLVCPECYKAEQEILEHQAPKIAYLDVAPASIPLLQVTVTGQIKANQDALKSLGYTWMEAAGGFKEYINGDKPKLRLGKYSEQTFEFSHILAFIKKCRIELEQLGYTLVNNLSEIDKGLLKRQLASHKAQQAEKQKRLTADPKPEKICYQFMFDRHGEKLLGWNGKFYGSRSNGHYYYYFNEKISVTDEQYQAILDYQTAYEAWKERNKDIL